MGSLDQIAKQRQGAKSVASSGGGTLDQIAHARGSSSPDAIQDPTGSGIPTVGTPKAKKSRGGILGVVEGGAHWIGSKAGLAAHDVKSIPGGIYELGKLEYNALAYDAQHPNLGHHESWHDFLHGSNNPASHRLGQTEVGMARATKTTVEHPLRDPLQFGLTVLPVVGAVGRVGGAVGAVGKAASEGGTIGDLAKAAVARPPLRPRLIRVGDEQVPLQASKSPAIRGVQAVHDKIVQRAIDRNPEGRVASYGTKRVGGSIDETARYQQRLRDVPAQLLNQAARRLSSKVRPGQSRVNQAALELTSTNTPARVAAAYHLEQARKGVNPPLNRAVAKLYQAVDKRGLLTTNEHGDVIVNAADHGELAQADLQLAHVQGRGDEILTRYGVRSPEALQSAIDAPGRYRAGGTFEKPTPGKAGVPSQVLLKARARVARLESLHERAIAKASDTLTSVNPTGGVFAKYDPASRASRPLGENMATLDSTMGVHPDEPVVIYRGAPTGQTKIVPGDFVTTNRDLAKDYGPRVIAKRVPASHVLDDKSEPLGEEYIYRPAGYAYGHPSPTAERLGSTLSVARDELQRLEQQAANRQRPTGIVGGETARPGRGHVSYAGSEPKAPKSSAASASSPVVGAPRSPITSHANEGYNIEHGVVPNDITGTAARHYQQIVRFVNTTEHRDQAIRTGADTRRTSRDVLVKIAGAEHHAQIPNIVNEILGKSKVTNDDVAGVQAALHAFKEDLVPGLRDRFATDRHTGIGTPAPEGYRWVDRNVLGDLAKPATGPRGHLARTADSINSAVTAATVYFKIGHIGTRVLTNATTNIIQGSAHPLEIAKSVRLFHDISEDDRLRALAAAGQHGFQAMPHAGQNVAGRVATVGANWWAKHVDSPFRFNSIAYEARRAGFDTPAKFHDLLDRLENPHDHNMNAAEAAKVDWVAKRANREGIAYDRLSEFERRYLTRAVWFYPWLRGTVGYAANTALEHPLKAGAFGAVGAEGRRTQQKELGDLPSFAQGNFKIGGSSSNPLVADFSTFSPYATPADILDAGAHPAQLAGFLNPTLSAGLNLITGVNQYGQKSTSPIGDALSALASPTPESQIVTAFLQRHQNQSRRMYPKSPALAGTASPLLRALLGPGVPRRMNVRAAHSAAARERTGR